MPLEALRKIKIVLEKLLEDHSLDVEEPEWSVFYVGQLIENTNIDKKQLGLILKQLQERGLIVEMLFDVDSGGKCYLEFSKDFLEKGASHLKELSAKVGISIKDGADNKALQKIELFKKNGSLYLIIGKQKKKYFLSDDLGSRKSKLVCYLSDPYIGISKTLDSVFDEIRKDKDVSLNKFEKRKIITGTLKEIQRTLNNQKAPISFSLKWLKDLVTLSAESG